MNARYIFLVILALLVGWQVAGRSDETAVKETSFQGPNKVTIKLRMEGPYDADIPLQIVCYFKHKESGDTMKGAALELDQRLGGAISSLRNRGEFIGDELETLLLVPPPNSIKPKLLLLIGLGDEDSLSKERMERVGRVALREATRLGATRVAFAPLLRDQGNSKLDTGVVERAVTSGVLLAYDTEKRLQQQGLARSYILQEWVAEAGPTYYDETMVGLKESLAQASEATKARDSKPYSTKSK